jgi:threonyl-tRNA synthetase
VPYVAVIGAREAAAGAVSLRLRGGEDLPARPAAEALELIKEVVDSRSQVLIPS